MIVKTMCVCKGGSRGGGACPPQDAKHCATMTLKQHNVGVHCNKTRSSADADNALDANEAVPNT